MNYEWEKQIEKGQRAIGYVEIYTTKAEDINIKAIVNYFPKLNEFSKNRICHVTFFFECEKQEITDGFAHWIYDDILDLITAAEDNNFEKGTNKVEFMLTQAFFSTKMPDFEYFTHGDYNKSSI